MTILKYNLKIHREIIRNCQKALSAGKIIAYPTDTSYGLGCDIENPKGVKKLYLAKERNFSRPVSVVVPSITYAKKIVQWDRRATRLARAFWPGPLTLVLPLNKEQKQLRKFTGNTGYLGIRMPDSKISLDLARALKRPITATSANPSAHLSGGFDSYSGDDVLEQFTKQKHKPDIIIDIGRIPKRKPSTLVKLTKDGFEILRRGPVSEKQIIESLK